MKSIWIGAALLLLIAALMPACFTKKESGKTTTTTPSAKGDAAALTLLKNNCLNCHATDSKSHDDLIAPPIIAVKRRYSTVYTEREDFIRHIVDWAKKPTDDKAIMYGAVNRFKVMPYIKFEEKDLRRIAAYLYDNEVEQPAWFEAHFKEMHPNGNATPPPVKN